MGTCTSTKMQRSEERYDTEEDTTHNSKSIEDLIRIRVMERQMSMKIQRCRYTREWCQTRVATVGRFKALKSEAHAEYKRRCAELESYQASTLKHIDAVRQECDFKLQTLELKVEREIKLIASPQQLKQNIQELRKSYSTLVTLDDCYPRMHFYADTAMSLTMTRMCVGSLSEMIGSIGHRCFSSGIVNLVESYVRRRRQPKTQQPTTRLKGSLYTKVKVAYGEGVYISDAIGLTDGRVAICHNAQSGGGTNSIRVCDSWSGQQLLELNGHTKYVRCLADVGDNRLLSGSGDKTIRLWDLRTGQCIQVLRGHTGPINTVFIFTDATGTRRGGSMSSDQTIRIWDLEEAKVIKTLRFKGTCQHISASADGSVIVSGYFNGQVDIWNPGMCDRDVVTSKAFQGNFASSVSVLSDSKRALCSCTGNVLRVYDLDTTKCLQVFTGHTDYVDCVSVFADGRRAVSGSKDGTMRVWDMHTGKCIKVVNVGVWVTSVCCLEDGRVIVTANKSSIQIWE